MRYQRVAIVIWCCDSSNDIYASDLIILVPPLVINVTSNQNNVDLLA